MLDQANRIKSLCFVLAQQPFAEPLIVEPFFELVGLLVDFDQSIEHEVGVVALLAVALEGFPRFVQIKLVRHRVCKVFTKTR